MNFNFRQCLLMIMGVAASLTYCKKRDAVDERTTEESSSPATTQGDHRTLNAYLAPNGGPHILPVQTKESAKLSLNVSGRLQYFGGKILDHVEIVPVFWGPTVNPNTTANIGNFFAGILASSFFDWLPEYSTNFAKGTNQILGRGTAKTPVTITPFNTNNFLTDTAIQIEIDKQITAGNLPTPTPNSLYMTYFPAGYTTSLGAIDSCRNFCGFHGTATSSAGQEFFYAVMPDLSDVGCDTGCGAGPTTFDNLTSVSSHELIEAITDPEVGFATVTGPPMAWFDPLSGEIGDLCNHEHAQITSTIDGKIITVQTEWSNLYGGCIANAPAPVAPSPDVIQLRTSNATLNSFDISWINGGGTTAGFVVALVPGLVPTVDCTSGTDNGLVPTFSSTGLTPGTSYSARVCSYNKTRQISPGVTITGVTLAPSPPTVTLTGNGTTTLTATAGTSINFTWNSQGAASASSTQVVVDGPDACGTPQTPAPWVATTLAGSQFVGVARCQAGHTYNYTYTATNNIRTTSTTFTLKVSPLPAPTVLITANFLTGPLRVKAGDTVSMAWNATGADTATSSISTSSTDTCGASMVPTGFSPALLTNRVDLVIPVCASGNTYTYTFIADNGAGQKSQASVILVVADVPAATASLIVNDLRGSATVKVGDKLAFIWSSNNGVSANSTISVNAPDSCVTPPNGTPWVANTTNGTATSTVMPCQGGHIYTYTFNVTNQVGKTTSTSLTLTVQGGPPTASLKANGIAGTTSVHPGSQATFVWSSLNATSAKSTMRANTKDKCGTPTTITPWLISTLSGTMTIPIPTCMAGHVYTFGYTTSNQTTTSKTAVFTLKVLKN